MKFTLDESGIDKLQRNTEGVDMDKVKEQGLKNAADELAERARDNIKGTDINSPSHLNSPYYRGHPEGKVTPGPSISRGEAWRVNRKGKNTYQVSIHPEVRRRAIFLEYGTSGPITSNSGNPMKFYVNGVPRLADSVSGVRAQGFWRGALAHMRSKDRVQHHVEKVLENELEKNNLK